MPWHVVIDRHLKFWPQCLIIERHVEFEGNAEHERASLYLRPLRDGRPILVDGASESQERWGGLHATLCAFAPAADSGGVCAHRGSSSAAPPASTMASLRASSSSRRAAAASRGASAPGPPTWARKKFPNINRPRPTTDEGQP